MSLQGNLFLKAPASTWAPPSLSELPSWDGVSRVGLDIETRDPNLKSMGPGDCRRDGEIVGVSFAFEDGPSFYLPLAHEGGGNVCRETALAYLRAQADGFEGTIVGANLPYDLGWLRAERVEFALAKFADVLIADPVLNELHLSYSLQAVAERHGFPGKEETQLKRAAEAFGLDPKKDLWRLPSTYVGEYAEMDARLPLALLRKMERRIEEEDLGEIWELESAVLPVLSRMRSRGVRVDMDRVQQVEEWSYRTGAEALAEVRRLTGLSIAVEDVWKSDAVAPILLSLGVPLKKTPKTNKYQVNKEAFDLLDHPVAKLVARARKVDKLRTTFAASIRRFAVPHGGEYRIHCRFNQMAKEDDGDGEGTRGARFGRLSSEKPNLQQQPAREDFAEMWRSIYRPDEGKLWFAADYSQQEPRILVHYAELSKFSKARDAAERYRTDPKADSHQMMADLTGLKRKDAKAIFLGKCYGMGGAKLCRSLGLPTKVIEVRGRKIAVAGEQGAQIIAQFDEKLPYVKLLADRLERLAKSRGWIKTLLGRKLHFPEDELGNREFTHKALNRLIQGSAADQTKRALVETDRAGLCPQLQVHDELDGSIGSLEEARELKRIMETCVPLNVPSRVDLDIGPSWGEAREVG